jgi:competence protein ComEC
MAPQRGLGSNVEPAEPTTRGVRVSAPVEHAAPAKATVPRVSLGQRRTGKQNAVGVEKPRAQPLIFVAAALAAGIVVDRYWPIPAAAWLSIGIAGLLVWLFVRRILRNAPLPLNFISTVLPVGALIVTVAACGGLRHHLYWRLFAVHDVGRYAHEISEPVCLEAVAAAAPRVRPAPPPDPLRSLPQESQTVVQVEVTAIRDGNRWQPLEGSAILTADGSLLGLNAGDRLRVVGRLQSPRHPGNPGEFDFALHRRGDRQLADIRVDHPDCVQTISRAPAYSPRRLLGTLRIAADRLLWGTLSHERAGLASAVLLGAREELDDEQKDQFLVTGTVHILSISGLHVGILAFVLFKAFRTGWVPRLPALGAVAVLTLTYAMLTGAEPPALRATVLVWVACGAIWLGRSPLGANSLALAAILVLAINPVDLFRTGTQLSFLSVATLSAMAPMLMRRQHDPLTLLIRRTRPLPVRMLREAGGKVASLALAGAMIWLVTAPLVLYRFHLLSVSALVLNVILWIPVLLAMMAGFGILMVGWIVPPLGALFGIICDANLAMIEGSIDTAARWPGSHFWTSGPPLAWLFGYYAILAAAWFAPHLLARRRPAVFAGSWVLAGLVLIGLGEWRYATYELTCGFVDVGHGSAVVLELPNSQVWLYDAGRLGSPRAGTRSIEAYLRSRGISHLDAVILSHADIDHYNALPELLGRFGVSVVYVSPQMFREQAPPLSVLAQSIEDAGVRLETLAVGDELAAGECTARVLHPPETGVAGNDNAQSIVLSLEYDGRRVLLTGDLEGAGMQRLLASKPLDCDILLAPHHGSVRSRPAEIVNWSTPEWAVQSSGNLTGQATNPYEALLGRRALDTSDVGAVRAQLSAEHIEVRAWRVDPWE